MLKILSKWISDVFNPLFALLIFFIYYNWNHNSFADALSYIWPILLIVVLPTALWIFYNVKAGKYSNADVSNREQRKSLYFFIEAALVIYLMFNYFRNDSLDYIMFFVLILLALMQISNYFIKSSMHTAFNVFTAALFFSENMVLGAIWLIISVIVGASRVILKRHTPAEVFAGTFIAIVVSSVYLFINIQFNQH